MRSLLIFLQVVLLSAVIQAEVFKKEKVKIGKKTCLCDFKIKISDKCSGSAKCDKKCSGTGTVELGGCSLTLRVKKGKGNILKCFCKAATIPGSGFGETPVPMIGSGETPVPMTGSGETPVPMTGSGETPVPIPGSGCPPPVGGEGMQCSCNCNCPDGSGECDCKALTCAPGFSKVCPMMGGMCPQEMDPICPYNAMSRMVGNSNDYAWGKDKGCQCLPDFLLAMVMIQPTSRIETGSGSRNGEFGVGGIGSRCACVSKLIFGPPSCIEVDIDFYGNDIGYIGNIGSVTDCACKCKGMAGCSFFTWNSGTLNCILKSSDQGRKSSTGALSGSVDCYKECQEDSTMTGATPTPSPTPFSTTTTTPSPSKTAILMTGGWDRRTQTTAEVFFPSTNTGCSVNNYALPTTVHTHTMNTFQKQTLICGGSPARVCFEFSPASLDSLSTVWPKYANLTEGRYEHTSWVSSAGLVLIGGCAPISANAETTAEYVNGGNLPFTLPPTRDACAIGDASSDSFILTGGRFNQFKVTRYNLQGFVEHLPNMNRARTWHACGSFESAGQMVLIVAKDSTEKLVIGESRWSLASPLPRTISIATGLNMNNKFYILGGRGSSDIDISADIFEYDADQDTWKKVGGMQQARYRHAAAVIYGDFEDLCN